MESETDDIKLDVGSWKIRIDERSRGRMKLQVKLSKDEAMAFKNFSEVCKPQEIPDEDFIKTVFLTGIEALNQQLADLVQKYASENREELAASGITVIEDEDGNVQLAPTEVIEAETSGADSVSPVAQES